MTTFGDLIQRCRIDADMTLHSAADLLGVSALCLEEFELGRTPPFGRARIEKLAAIYNVDSEPLLEAAWRERGLIEVDMAHATSVQMKALLGIVRGVSEDQWAEIHRIVNRERREDKKSSTGVLKLAALATATAK